MVQCRRLIPFISVFVLCVVFIGVSTGQYAGTDKSLIPRLKWMGPGKPDTMAEYQAKHPVLPFKTMAIETTGRDISLIPGEKNKIGFINEKVKSTSPIIFPLVSANGEKLLVLVNQTIYGHISSRVNRYVNTMTSAGYTVELHSITGGTPQELKGFIAARKENLVGCILIGNFPVAWFEEPEDWEPDELEPEFPCDLFFMDLDGSWEDKDGDGIYDLHTNGTGDEAPEIFVARIDASTMKGEEAQIMKEFFDKNHRYWTGNMDIYPYGLVYTEDDWTPFPDFAADMAHLYQGNYKVIDAPATAKEDYRDLRLKNPAYEFIQLSCHSSSQAHHFTRGGQLKNDEILQAIPCGLGYNLFCCSGARFTATNFLAGTYVFNYGNKALVAVGSSKTGSMLEFHQFYKPLGQNKTVGESFKLWFQSQAPYSNSDLSWFYGMVIIGDPMISFRNVNLSAPKPVFPPVNFNVKREENRSLLAVNYINVVSWNANPANQDLKHSITAYRVYLVDEQGRVQERLGEVNTGETEFAHKGIEDGKTYFYAVSAVNAGGKESSKFLIPTSAWDE